MKARGTRRRDCVPVLCSSVDCARDYVDAHLRERIALRDVAAAAGVTPTRLRADLRRHTGETFVGLVRRG
jgi:AraC-like DNA-binding protein